MKCNHLVVRVLFFSIISRFAFAQEREIKELTSGWKFFKGPNEPAYQRDFDDSDWRNVKIPHNWAIEEPFLENVDGNTGKLT